MQTSQALSSRGEVLAALERVLASKLFRRAERLSAFLRYAVEEMLDGRAEELKEYRIGLAVFGRREDFDPRVDPIVRVEAGRLRLRLKQHYETGGAADCLRIEIPKGRYVPRIIACAEQTEPDEAPPDSLSESASGRTGILVASFTDCSPSHDHAYLCQGLRDELIGALTKTPALRVFAHPASMGAGTEFQQPWLDEQTRADYVLMGSVRCADSRVRVSAQLILSSERTYVWSETFERELVDVFLIQEEIARAIVARLKIGLAEGDPRHPRRHTRDPRAYNLYLKGRYFWNRRTEPGLWKGVDFFHQAIAADSQYALAYTGLADSYMLLANYGSVQPGEARGKAKEAAMRAIEIDHGLAEAHSSLAHVLATFEWNWEAAEREYEMAIGLDSDYATAHHWYAITLLGPLGRLDEATFEIERARNSDPVSLSINRDLAIIQVFRRRYDLAVEQCRRTIALDARFPGGYWVLGMACQQLGDHEQAVQSFQQALELAADYPRLLGALGHSYAVWGRRTEALRILARLEELSRHRYVNPFESALVYIGLGETDTAFFWLERVCSIRAYELVSLQMDPRFDPLRTDARYLTLLDCVGLRYFAEKCW